MKIKKGLKREKKTKKTVKLGLALKRWQKKVNIKKISIPQGPVFNHFQSWTFFCQRFSARPSLANFLFFLFVSFQTFFSFLFILPLAFATFKRLILGLFSSQNMISSASYIWTNFLNNLGKLKWNQISCTNFIEAKLYCD